MPPSKLKEPIQTQIYLEKRQRDALFRLAEKYDTSLAEMVRRAVDRLIEKEAKSDEAKQQ